MAKPKVSRFTVTFTVEVEHKGKANSAINQERVEEAVTDVIDRALFDGKGAISRRGIKITDAHTFRAETE